MARTSTIRISQGRRGTTIRATGSAAQALFAAITGAATAAKAAVETRPPLARRYSILVRVEEGSSTGYTARALIGEGSDEEAVGLLNKVATSSESAIHALQQLLNLATPPLRVIKGETAQWGRTTDYTLITEKS